MSPVPVQRKKRIGFVTSGGDAPGINTAFYHTVRLAHEAGYEVVVIRNGIVGFAEDPHVTDPVDYKTLSIDWLDEPGTVAGSGREKRDTDISGKVKERMAEFGIDTMVVAVGDGSLEKIAHFPEKGIHTVCFPASIDRNIRASETCLGFSTARGELRASARKAKATAMSFRRIALVGAMGKKDGDLGQAGAEDEEFDILFRPEWFNLKPGEDPDAAPHRMHDDFELAMQHLIRIYTERAEAYEKGHRDYRVRNPYATVMLCEGTARLDGETNGHSNGDGHTTLEAAVTYYADLIQKRTGIAVTPQPRTYDGRGADPNGVDQELARRFIEKAFTAIHRNESGLVVTHESVESIVSLPRALGMQQNKYQLHVDLAKARELGIYVVGDPIHSMHGPSRDLVTARSRPAGSGIEYPRVSG